MFAVRVAPSTSTVRRIINRTCPGGLADLLGTESDMLALLLICGLWARLAHAAPFCWSVVKACHNQPGHYLKTRKISNLEQQVYGERSTAVRFRGRT
ncbi:hypothetical protein [Streptomyces sp. NPDC001450]